MDNKKWFHSKTLWSNVILFAGVMILEFTGSNPLNPELVAALLAGVNMMLRVVTKTGLTT